MGLQVRPACLQQATIKDLACHSSRTSSISIVHEHLFYHQYVRSRATNSVLNMQILQRRVQCSQLSNQPCSSAGCSAWGKTSTHFPATQRRLCTEHSRTRHIRSSASNPSTRVGELDPSLGDLEDSWTDSVFLPNGLEVHSVSKADVAFLYDEIWEQRAYLDHGISIGPGDTVLDVGANIGLFSIQAARVSI